MRIRSMIAALKTLGLALVLVLSQMAKAAGPEAAPGVARGHADSTLELTPYAVKEVWVNYLLEAAYADDKTKLEIFDRMVKFLVQYHLSPISEETVATEADLKRLDIHRHFETFPVGTRIDWVESYKHLRRVSVRYADRALGAKEAERQRQSNLDLIFQTAIKETAGFFAKSAMDPVHFFEELHANLPSLTTDGLKLAFINRFEKGFGEAIRQIESVGEVISKDPALEIKDGAMRSLLRVVVGSYFKLLGLKAKKSIVSSLLDLPPDAKPLQIFPRLIVNAGPQFQKMIQLMARKEGLSREIEAVFTKLEKDGQPIAWPLIEREIMKHQYPFEWVSIDPVPMGAGTMAQIHRAVIRKDGHLLDVVVRVLKPGIEEKVDEDERILEEIAPIIDADPEVRAQGLPTFVPITEEITQGIRIELGIQETSERQKIGQRVYRKSFKLKTGDFVGKIHFQVPDVIDTPGVDRISVQSFMKGQSFEKVMDQMANEPPLLRRRIAEAMAAMWWREVLFNEGFFHGDLHRGNFLVRHEGNEITLVIIDYGMGGTLSARVQTLLVLISGAVQIRSPKGIALGLWEMRNPDSTRVDLNTFSARVQSEIAAINAGKIPDKDFEQWVSWATQQGVGFSFEFVNLNRGIKQLNSVLEKTGSSFDTMRLSRTIARERIFRVVWNVLRSGYFGPKDLTKLVFNILKDLNEERKVRSNERREERSGTRVRTEIPASTSAGLRCEGLFSK